MTPALSRLGQRSGALPLAIAGGLSLCAVLDFGLLRWIQVGPPGGKGDIFFLEFALLLVGAGIFGVTVLTMPDRLRPAIPAVFAILAWHTGFQVNLSGDDILVVSAFDALVPLIALLALAGHWQRDVFPGYAQIVRALAVFWIFCVWGTGLALARGVDPVPFLANLKSFIIYPLIALLIPLCIGTWKQLYVAAGLMLALVSERALEGMREGASSVTKTLLTNGQVVARIDGHMDSVNQYACYLMTGLLVMAAIIVLARSHRLRLVTALPALAVAAALLLTLSRGAWLATAVGIVVLASLSGARRALGLVAVALIAWAVLLAVQPHAATLVAGRIGRYDNSIQARQSYLTLGMHVIEQYPLGAGWGAAFVETPTGLQPSNQAPWYHNDYLQLGSEIGIPGLLAFLALWLILLRLTRRAVLRLQGTQRAISAGLLAACCGLLLQAGTEQMFWRANIAPHFWIVAGFAMAAANLQSREQSISP
ncbi:MAG: O-antigen ligase family protein [Chloroflexota bacterium]|nr:O-antigen ligase family protein [Chloroflexota bacterium]